MSLAALANKVKYLAVSVGFGVPPFYILGVCELFLETMGDKGDAGKPD